MPQSTEKFEFATISKEDVYFEVRSFKNKTSTGPDGVSNKTFKNILPLIIHNFVICMNKSLE